MKRKSINIEWASMTGMGPRAWDRDDKQIAIHTPHRHAGIHHTVKRNPESMNQEQKTGNKQDIGLREQETPKLSSDSGPVE